MGHLLSSIASLSEQTSLFVMGVGLIAATLVLRRVISVLRDFTRSNSTRIADNNSLARTNLNGTQRQDEVAGT